MNIPCELIKRYQPASLWTNANFTRLWMFNLELTPIIDIYTLLGLVYLLQGSVITPIAMHTKKVAPEKLFLPWNYTSTSGEFCLLKDIHLKKFQKAKCGIIFRSFFFSFFYINKAWKLWGNKVIKTCELFRTSLPSYCPPWTIFFSTKF